MRRIGCVAAAMLCAACATPKNETKPPPAPVATAAVAPAAPTAPAPRWVYPATRAEAVRETMFGVEVADPFRWLEDEKHPEVQAWMQSQDALTRAELAKIGGRDALKARLVQLNYVDAVNLPQRRGGRYFYSRNHADREKAVWYWRDGLEGAEKLLLDPNTMSADGSTSVGLVKPSWDGKRVAFSVKANNSDEATLKILDVATGKESAIDVIPGAKYADPQWTTKSDGFYYTYLPPLAGGAAVSDRPGTAEIRYHKLGTDPKSDTLVYGATKDPKTFLRVELGQGGRLVLVSVRHGWSQIEYYYRDVGKKGAFAPLITGKPFVYEIEEAAGKLFIYSNEDAPRYRVFAADIKKPLRADWKEIIPQAADTMSGISYFGGALAVTYLHDATSLLEIHELDGKLRHKTQLPGLGTIYGLSGSDESDEIFYAYQSFVQPRQVYRASVKSAGSTLWGGANLRLDAAAYDVAQVFYPSKDGTKIPMFIVTKKGVARDGATPFLLTGYGGFNISRTPAFLGSTVAWLELGGGYALPNLRGGGEYGEDWHKAGMQHQKQNVFDDFVGAAEYLIKEKYTSPGKLAIFGRSNGGLLVGAAMTQRPELYRAVVCGVPLLDMVRYHLFGSGKTWIPEYGSAETEDDFRAIYAYSPYHHVKDKAAYPALLMLSADADDRVDPMHARKFAALVQARSTSDLPALLRVEKHSGHGGADLVRQTIEMDLDILSFLRTQLGVR